MVVVPGIQLCGCVVVVPGIRPRGYVMVVPGIRLCGCVVVVLWDPAEWLQATGVTWSDACLSPWCGLPERRPKLETPALAAKPHSPWWSSCACPRASHVHETWTRSANTRSGSHFPRIRSGLWRQRVRTCCDPGWLGMGLDADVQRMLGQAAPASPPHTARLPHLGGPFS